MGRESGEAWRCLEKGKEVEEAPAPEAKRIEGWRSFFWVVRCSSTSARINRLIHGRLPETDGHRLHRTPGATRR